MLPQINIGSLVIPSYGICMDTGIVIAFLVSYYRLRARGGSVDSLLMIAAVAMAVGLILAKIAFYIFSYGVDRLISELLTGDFSGFSNAGLVYYGGLIGGIAGACVAIRVSKLDFDTYACAIVPCIPLGHAFGRIGCLLAGCCYGLRYKGAFAVHSVYVDTGETLFPIQAVESIWNIVLFTALSLYSRKKKNGHLLLEFYIVLYAIARFILEFFRGDLIRGVYWGFSTSQWISFLLASVCLALIVRNRRQGRTESTVVP